MPLVRTQRLACCLLVAGVAGMGAPPALAHPPAPVNEKGKPITGSLHVWMHQAKVPLVHGRVQIRREVCPGNPALLGCVWTPRPRTLYLSPRVPDLRTVLYHELGHAFDLRVLNRRDRGRFKRIIRIRRRGWFSGALPPSEWFADAYRACAVRTRVRRRAHPTFYGYAPTKRQHARACRLIHDAAAPRGRRPRRPKNPPRVIEVPPPPAEQTQPDEGPGCNLVDELLTGCAPATTPPGPPLP
jgi:hypothetical protein